jgi:hypothetical protein
MSHLTAVYVHWGRLTNLLRNAMTVTLRFGTNTTLLSDFEADIATRNGVVFSRRPLNCTGCAEFHRVFASMHREFKSEFVSYPHVAEFRNEVRYVVLYNYMASFDLSTAVMLDSDVALLVPAYVAFDVKWYSGCDAVLTYNQVSARIMPIHPTKLDAYWAGTALLRRPVLHDYFNFVRLLYTDPLLRELLIRKQRTLPTINDMTSWCLFTAAQGSGTRTPDNIIDVLRRSSAARLMYTYRMCNTQPISWSRHFDKGVIASASNEIRVAMINCDRIGCHLNGSAYVRQYELYRRADVQYLAVSRERIMSATPRLYSLHSKELALPTTVQKLRGRLLDPLSPSPPLFLSTSSMNGFKKRSDNDKRIAPRLTY